MFPFRYRSFTVLLLLLLFFFRYWQNLLIQYNVRTVNDLKISLKRPHDTHTAHTHNRFVTWYFLVGLTTYLHLQLSNSFIQLMCFSFSLLPFFDGMNYWKIGNGVCFATEQERDVLFKFPMKQQNKKTKIKNKNIGETLTV